MKKFIYSILICGVLGFSVGCSSIPKNGEKVGPENGELYLPKVKYD